MHGVSPLILSKSIDSPWSKSVFVQTGVNVTFKCRSDEPIHWRPPWNDSKNKYRSIFHQFYDEEYYEAHLSLVHANHSLVGHYYCAKNASSKSNLQTQFQHRLASRIYLFVKGIAIYMYKLISY